MINIQLTAEETASAMFLHYFLYRRDFRRHFRPLMEQIVGSANDN